MKNLILLLSMLTILAGCNPDSFKVTGSDTKYTTPAKDVFFKFPSYEFDGDLYCGPALTLFEYENGYYSAIVSGSDLAEVKRYPMSCQFKGASIPVGSITVIEDVPPVLNEIETIVVEETAGVLIFKDVIDGIGVHVPGAIIKIDSYLGGLRREIGSKSLSGKITQVNEDKTYDATVTVETAAGFDSTEVRVIVIDVVL